MRDLGTLGGATGVANAINDAGEVVGLADTSNSTHGFLWRNGAMTDLGTIGDDCFSGAFGINAHTQVVGQSINCDFTVFRAFLWENGAMIDLNIFVPAGSNLTLNDVEQINDRGELFGIGTLADGNSRAFLLIPCDENHPNIEGCDYSMVDQDVLADGGRSGSARRQQTNSDRKLSSGEIGQMMKSANARSKNWFLFDRSHGRMASEFRL